MFTPDNAELTSLLLLSFKVADLSEANPPDVESVDLENRRRSVRFAFEPPLDIFEKAGYRQIGRLVDLSIDGFRMISDRAVAAGRAFVCRVKLPRPIFGQDFILLEVRCRWCRKNDEDAGYESGHSIVNVSKQDAAVILRLLIHDGRNMRTRPRLQVVKQHAK